MTPTDPKQPSEQNQFRMVIKTIDIRSATVLLVFLIGLVVAAQSRAEISIEYSFAPAEMEAPDERAMADHLRSAINLRCEFVKFNATPLVNLIDEIAERVLKVNESSITVRFLDGFWMKYVGSASEVGQAQSRRGPHVWEGSADESDSFATFVVQSENRTKAYISKSGVMYVLYPSNWSEDYFLCMRDPDFRGQKID